MGVAGAPTVRVESRNGRRRGADSEGGELSLRSCCLASQSRGRKAVFRNGNWDGRTLRKQGNVTAP